MPIKPLIFKMKNGQNTCGKHAKMWSNSYSSSVYWWNISNDVHLNDPILKQSCVCLSLFMTGWEFNDLILVPLNKQLPLSFRTTSNKMTKSNFVHFLLLSLFSILRTSRLGYMYYVCITMCIILSLFLFIIVKSLSLSQGGLETMLVDTVQKQKGAP